MSDKVIVVKTPEATVDQWVNNLSNLLPEFTIKRWDGVFPTVDVQYIVGWMPNARWMNQFPNIKAIVSLGSGVDHIKNLSELREDIPVIRTVSDDLTQRMREYIAMMVLSWHRKLPHLIINSMNSKWERFTSEVSSTIKVGIMGHGGMGAAVAATLSSLGYDVSVWANRERDDTPYHYFFGNEQLNDFISNQDVVVCLLPLTQETFEIFNSSTFNMMKDGACLINVGRGEHINGNALLKAIKSGKLSYAILDVLSEEPLPETSPLWTHRNILVSCHSASYISPQVGPSIVANNILKFDNGEVVSPLYNPALGY